MLPQTPASPPLPPSTSSVAEMSRMSPVLQSNFPVKCTPHVDVPGLEPLTVPVNLSVPSPYVLPVAQSTIHVKFAAVRPCRLPLRSREKLRVLHSITFGPAV